MVKAGVKCFKISARFWCLWFTTELLCLFIYIPTHSWVHHRFCVTVNMVTPYNLNSEELYRQDVVPFHIVIVSKRWTLFLIGLESLSFYVFFFLPRSGELRTQKLKSRLVRTQILNILPLKPGVGQHIAIHATLTARDFFLAYFYPSGPFTCIFPKPLPIFPVLAVTNTWFLCRPAE